MNFIFAILGVCGGLCTATGDMLMDLKGKGNEKLGTSKNIDSNWLKMSEWRFRLSVICGMIGCPLGGLGYYALAMQVEPSNATMAFVIKLTALVGTMGAFFIHTTLSIQPILYKRIMKTNQFELADDVLEGYYTALKVPFVILYIPLLVPTFCFIAAILNGYLDVPTWMLVCNPIVTSVIGWILRAVDKDVFYDMPAIIMNSIGTSLMCLVVAISTIG
ncbi:MAG: hypothetical protein IJ397_00025 [Lachnospiraceae bacterium]|nr:hypothetical protein [Lachnospiraceae bacterium]